MGKDIDEAASGFGNVFRDRLTYLMNGNNVYGSPSTRRSWQMRSTSAAPPCANTSSPTTAVRSQCRRRWS